MPQYAVLLSHPPDDCPLTNLAVREFVKKNMPQLQNLARQTSIKILLFIHLDPSHKAFMLFEAPSAEAVRDLLYKGGLFHFGELEFHLVTSVDDLLKKADDFPTLY